MKRSLLRLLGAVVENVGVPVGSFLLLTRLGWQPVWALVRVSGVSVLILAGQYLRQRRLTARAVPVLVRFALGVAIAVISGDARLEVARDLVITSAICGFAVLSPLLRRPFVARIRRDLSGDPEQFELRWTRDRESRQVYHRLTLVWAVALMIEGAVAVVLICTLPLTTAVVATNILAPATLPGLIRATEWRARRYLSIHPDPPEELQAGGLEIVRHAPTGCPGDDALLLRRAGAAAGGDDGAHRQAAGGESFLIGGEASSIPVIALVHGRARKGARQMWRSHETPTRCTSHTWSAPASPAGARPWTISALHLNAPTDEAISIGEAGVST
ncbi:VC0807 family protein [Streptomyces griseoluteus]|uniref:VC0807 family protein n=1 Tax=Streptomyces griseoluteus TaxID=29306 RepID=UPI0038188ACF